MNLVRKSRPSEVTSIKEECTIEIKCDNKSGIDLARNNTYHALSKHIDIHHHYIRDLIEADDMRISYTKTRDMVADIMTKGLPSAKHIHHCNIFEIRQ